MNSLSWKIEIQHYFRQNFAKKLLIFEIVYEIAIEAILLTGKPFNRQTSNRNAFNRGWKHKVLQVYNVKLWTK